MGRVLRFIKLITLFFCLLPIQTKAAAPDFEFSGRYEFAFSGIPFGRFDITMSQTANLYQATSDIEITGIAKMFVTHESHTTSKGQGKNFHYPSMIYETTYSTRKKPKYVKLMAKNGVWVKEDVRPPDNRATRPAVSAKDKKGAVDPLFLAFSIRTELARCLKVGCKNFSQTYYDGRRLTRLDFSVVQEKNIRIKGNKYPAYELTCRRTPLAGYTQKELAKIGDNDPILTLYMSHDERMVPLLLTVNLPFGTASATLV